MGKSSSTTVGYHYRMAYHVGLCRGPIDAFLEFRAADKTAWAGELTASGSIQINQPELFGGEKDQGGIVGRVDVMFGEPTQLPNAYLTGVFGSQTAAWRGLATLAWCGGRFGAMNPMPQRPAYKIRKIIEGWDAPGCWYPEKAEVVLLGGFISMLGPGWEYQVEVFSEPNTAWDNFIPPTSGWLQGGELPFSTNGLGGGPYWTPARSNIWLRRRIQVRAAGLTLHIGADNGCAVWVNGAHVGSSNDTNANVSNNQTNPVSFPFTAVGEVEVLIKAWAEIGAANDAGNIVDIAFSGAQLLAMNPAHALYYVRTDSEKGREPRSNINDSSLRAAADQLYSEGFGVCWEYNPAIDTSASLEQRICQIVGGSFERSLTDGQWYLDLARGDYVIDELPVINDDDILEFKELPTTLDNAVNSLSVRYFDPQLKETVITPAVRALGLIRRFGEIHETLDFPEVPTAELALRIAERELRARVTPTRTFEVSTTPRPRDLRRNQYFRLQSPKRGIANMACIVGEKQAGTLRSGAIRWKFAQDIYDLPTTTYAEVELGVDTRPDPTAHPVLDARVYEAPYIDVSATLPRAELDALPDDVGYLLGAAASPGAGLNYTMAVQPTGGGDYAEVARGEWSPNAVIVEGSGKIETAFTISGGQRLEQVRVGSAALWGDEIVRVDAIDVPAGTITLGRGCADTVPAGHAAGERIWFIDENAAADTTEYTAGEAIDVKLLTNTGSQQLPQESATAMSLEFRGRQARPYPPADVTLNGQRYPAEVIGHLEIHWAHRDRVLQADQLIDHLMPSIGPEPGTTYEIEVLDASSNSVIYSVTDIESGPFVVSSSLLAYSNTLRIWSNLDGLRSLQAFEHQFTAGTEPWTPAHLAVDVAIWLDDQSSITDESGLLSTWGDRSGNGNDFTQSSPGFQPEIVLGPGDRRALRFENDHLVAGANALSLFAGIPRAWAFAVYRAAGTSNSDRPLLWASRSGATSSRFALEAGSPSNQNLPTVFGRRLDSDGVAGVAHHTAIVDEWCMLLGELDYSSRSASVRVDGGGASDATGLWTSGGNTSSGNSNGIRVGANVSGSSTFDGDIAAIIVGVGALPDSDDVDRLFGWAAWHYGLHDRLPPGHPYAGGMPMLGLDPITIDDNVPAVFNYYTMEPAPGGGFNPIPHPGVDHQFTAQGVVGTGTWTRISGQFPPGLDMDSAGRLTGTFPTGLPSNSPQFGPYDYTLRVVDGNGATAQRAFTTYFLYN